MLESLPTLQNVGQVQPAGTLVVLDADIEKVVAVSANIDQRIAGWSAETAIGASADVLLGDSVVHNIRNAAILPSFQRLPEPLEVVDLGGGDMAPSAHGRGNVVLVEFCDAGARPSALTLLRDLARTEDRLRSSDDVGASLKRISGLIRIMSGYDRVQVVLFSANGTAKLIATNSAGASKDTDPSEIVIPWTDETPEVPPSFMVSDARARPTAVFSESLAALDLTLCATAQPREDRLQHLQALGMVSELVLPIRDETRMLGALIFQSRRARMPSLRFRYFCTAVTPYLTQLLSRRASET